MNALRPHSPSVFVTDAASAIAADNSAMAGGVTSRVLMQRAGAAATAEICRRYGDCLNRGIVVLTGGGNNGGDGWVVARALYAVGIRVRVMECMSPRTSDAIAERDLAISCGVGASPMDCSASISESVVVDSILGTGYSSANPLRPQASDAIKWLAALSEPTIVALDMPSGVDATNGDVAIDFRCDLTLSFGSFKRGQLIARAQCGAIAVLDIGLRSSDFPPESPLLVTLDWFRRTLPRIDASAHKGTRKKLGIIGGANGMSGAVVLAARAALRSGAGMVKCIVAEDSMAAVQKSEPAVLTAPWPVDRHSVSRDISDWADVLLIGPGLGREHAREIVELTLSSFTGPVVLDADALNAFEGDVDALATLIGAREALLTPHPLEFSRLIGLPVKQVNEHRFEAPAELASRLHASVLLKGVPTVIASPSRRNYVSGEGTPILATAGSGDVLGGIAATLLSQTDDAFSAGALAAFAHGRAASYVDRNRVRGYTLDDVLTALPHVWSLTPPVPRSPVLAELAPIPGGA